jgi:hypothetical protein
LDRWEEEVNEEVHLFQDREEEEDIPSSSNLTSITSTTTEVALIRVREEVEIEGEVTREACQMLEGTTQDTRTQCKEVECLPT